MLKRGRSCIAAFTACAILLYLAIPAFASYNTDAGRKYAVACQRLADLKKSDKKKKYRSYWMDCLRTFEQVEKQYPKSPSAGDACFDRAGVYLDLYRNSRTSKDLDESIRLYGKCRSVHPKHRRAPEALYQVIDLTVRYQRERAAAVDAYAELSKSYPNNFWTKKAKTKLGPAATRVKKQDPEIKKPPTPVIASPAAKPSGMVKNIRYWSGGAYTRIVIDQDNPVKFQATELKNPERLVFDLLGTQLDASVDRDPLPVNDGILRQVRASQYAPDIVRVVLDLASIKSYAAFPLHDPERLVIDVTGEGGRTTERQAASGGTGTLSKEESATTSTQAKIEPPQQPKPVTIPKTPDAKNNDGAKLSLSNQMGLKIKTIAIDAGHGGHDPGAIGKNGLKEKVVTLDIAKRLAKLVKERLGCNVVMTRDKDVFIPLDQRPFIAKSRDADLFVSIHVNANRKRKTRGIETYIQGLHASDPDAMATAARENAMTTKKLSQLKSELDVILKDLTDQAKDDESVLLANAVQASLVGHAKPAQKTVNLGVKRAFFYVLVNTNMPSILAEVGFISNPEEEKMLKQDAYRQKIAEALYEGVKKFIDTRTPQMMGI